MNYCNQCCIFWCKVQAIGHPKGSRDTADSPLGPLSQTSANNTTRSLNLPRAPREGSDLFSTFPQVLVATPCRATTSTRILSKNYRNSNYNTLGRLRHVHSVFSCVSSRRVSDSLLSSTTQDRHALNEYRVELVKHIKLYPNDINVSTLLSRHLL